MLTGIRNILQNRLWKVVKYRKTAALQLATYIYITPGNLKTDKAKNCRHTQAWSLFMIVFGQTDILLHNITYKNKNFMLFKRSHMYEEANKH